MDWGTVVGELLVRAATQTTVAGLARAVAEGAVEVFGAHAAAFCLADIEHRCLRVLSRSGRMMVPVVASDIVPLDSVELAARAVNERTARSLHGEEIASGLPAWVCLHASPLITGGRVLGALLVVCDARSDVAVQTALRTLAAPLSMLLDRAVLLTERIAPALPTERREFAETRDARLPPRTADLADLYDHAPCGYHSVDTEGRVTRMNETELRWLGYEREEVIGRHVTGLLAPACREAARALHERAREQRELVGVPERERELLRKDGSTFWVLASAVVLRDEAGRVLEIRSTLIDITDRKRAEDAFHEQDALVRTALEDARRANAALAQASRAKDDFLASMSHELRTPLNGVLGFAEALEEGVYGPVNDKQIAALRRLHESGEHLLSLLNDVLDLAKVEAGKVELARAPVVLDELVQSSVGLVQHGAARKALRLNVSPAGRAEPVQLDVRRMKQVLVNLLSNAVKFTPSGGEIGVEVRADEVARRVSFTVRDTGIGIAAEDAARLFQPFVQLDSRLSREHAGTGLGLALVRRLVDLHGGEVALDSALGRGSAFTVTVPLVPVHSIETS